MKDSLEISYLKTHKKASLEAKGRWCQIDTFHNKSTISFKSIPNALSSCKVFQVHALQKVRQSSKLLSFGWHCIIKADETILGTVDIPLHETNSDKAVIVYNLAHDKTSL